MATDEAGTDPAHWLSELDHQAVVLLSGGRPDVAVAPHRDQVASTDFSEHPWAQLVVAAALNDWRDERAESMLEAGSRTFQERQDPQGLGYASCVRGNVALGRGQLAEAVRWYEHCREHLQRECPVDAAALAHTGLGAYMRGELRQAVAITEEALAIARIQGSRRYEGLACMYLAFFAVITGRFGRAESLLAVAEDTYRELADPMQRFELPLILAGQGVVAALRGDFRLADDRFTAAITTATEIDVQWYGAISLVLRAEFTASHDPRRSLADARNGLEQLVALGDTWWQTWAMRAQGTAAREAGDLTTSIEILERLLAQELNPMERGLTLLALGETILRTDQPRAAAAPLEEANRLLQGVGAGYWVARCWVALSKANPAGSDGRKRALALADDDPAYDRLLDSGPSDFRITVLGEAGVWLGDKRVTFATRNAEQAVFCLALASPAGLHDEVLIERLWRGAPADRGRARLRTILWQVRQALGREAWRIQRLQNRVALRMDGVSLDLAGVRERAAALLSNQSALDPDELASLASLLSLPVLPSWQYEAWVETETDRNERLSAALRSRQRRP